MAEQQQPPEQLKGFETLSPGTYNAPGGSIISYSHTPASQHKPGTPILVLLHGWPQTRYIWRYAVPVLSARGATLFVPDLPGYGYSTMSTASASDVGARSEHDRVSVGFAILSAVRAVYGGSTSPAKEQDELQVVLIGHDRGGRVAQRLVTSAPGRPLPVPQSLNIRVLGAMLLDIVPYSAQWSAHANPRASARYWHWTFLPSAFSVPMVQAYGGGRFCREIIAAVTGSSGDGRERLYADGAVEHYARCYERDEVIRGAAADYGAGAAEDWDAQQEDIKEGRKMQVPVVVLYCEGLAKMHDNNVAGIWKEWTSPDVKLDVHAMSGGAGHYLPEEAPEATNKHIVDFLEELGVLVS
ncbi:Alpha/Beta hydrolase protein [Xylaria palmicola]|nr:Alpha/Beta hydrolase protein [Xylaria palmicola]